MGMTFRGFLHRPLRGSHGFPGRLPPLILGLHAEGEGNRKDMIPGLKDAKDLLETLKNNFFITGRPKSLKCRVSIFVKSWSTWV